MRNIFVIGVSGLAKEMAQLIREVNKANQNFRFCGYISENTSDIGTELPWGQVVGDDAWLLAQLEPIDIVIGIGHPVVRQRVVQRYQARENFGFPNLIHPSVWIEPNYVSMGIGNIVTRGCVFTCDIVVGDFNLFNLNVTIGHDCQIGSYNVINPSCNISGNVTLRDQILVGTGAQILEGRRIASQVKIGAGAVVTSDIEKPGVWVGVPARSIR